MADPYVKKGPGDIIRAQDWNEAQAQARAQVEGHAHTGAPGQGVKLTGDAIAPDAALAVRSLAATDGLSAKGRVFLDEIDRLTAGVGASLPLRGGTLGGEVVAGGGLRMADADIRFRSGTDTNHGLGYYGGGKNFAGLNLDGPVLYGFAGGVLGTNVGGIQRAALTWDSAGNVGVPTGTVQAPAGGTLGALTIGPWPPGPGGYASIGSNALDQTQPVNYALLVGTGSEPGKTFLNSPVAIGFRIRNAEWMTLGSDGSLAMSGRLRVAQQEPWTTASLVNGWQHYPGWGPAGFMKDSLGFVHLRGLLHLGTMGQVAFTLPVGYRPEIHYLHCLTTGIELTGRINVFSDGTVVMAAGNNGWMSLDGIVFLANH